MKAIVHERYGSPDGLHLKEVPTPIPKDDEVLIRVHAASVNGSDRENLKGNPSYVRLGGLRRPRNQILGSDVSGVVERVGRNIKGFQVGDEVFGEIAGYHGGFAEYVCTREKTLARKPAGLTFDQAAAIPQGGAIALQAIDTKGHVQAGQHVLINGAGGSAGSFVVQHAKMRGAVVTAVDGPGKLEFLRSLGADKVIDYTRQDFTKSGNRYHLIVDLIAHRSALSLVRALQPRGTYFVVGGGTRFLIQTLLLGPIIKAATRKRTRVLVVPQDGSILVAVAELCEAGKIAPTIDRRYPLAAVAEALRYVDEGRHKGKVIINLVDTETGQSDFG